MSINRRNFLAIIPSLSAIPFIGKDIVKKSDRIEIYQPEEVKDYTKKLTNDDTYLAVVKNGQVIGTAYITNINVMNNHIETSCRDNDGASTFMLGGMTCNIEAELLGPITNDMVDGVVYTFNNQRPYRL